MGDLGYTSQAQVGLFISYNSLSEYTDGLARAIKTPYEPYEKFRPVNGIHQQVNSGILQIENEFYSTIRPKRQAPPGVRPIHALQQHGVEYIEVRCLDLNPFLPVGIDEKEILFLDSFLIFCLLRSSQPSGKDQYHEIEKNLDAVVNRGRDPDLLLTQNGEQIPLQEWALEILQETMEVAEVLDSIENGQLHGNSRATQEQIDKVNDVALTPSAKVIQRMEQMKASYFRFAMDQSLACSDYFRGRHLLDDKKQAFKALARQSDLDRKAVEDGDTEEFDSFLQAMNEI